MQMLPQTGGLRERRDEMAHGFGVGAAVGDIDDLEAVGRVADDVAERQEAAGVERLVILKVEHLQLVVRIGRQSIKHGRHFRIGDVIVVVEPEGREGAVFGHDGLEGGQQVVDMRHGVDDQTGEELVLLESQHERGAPAHIAARMVLQKAGNVVEGDLEGVLGGDGAGGPAGQVLDVVLKVGVDGVLGEVALGAVVLHEAACRQIAVAGGQRVADDRRLPGGRGRGWVLGGEGDERDDQAWAVEVLFEQADGRRFGHVVLPEDGADGRQQAFQQAAHVGAGPCDFDAELVVLDFDVGA